MRRGRIEITGEILDAIHSHPDYALNRIASLAGICYTMLTPLVLRPSYAEIVKPNAKKRPRRLRLTEKGKLYLQHYAALKQLCS